MTAIVVDINNLVHTAWHGQRGMGNAAKLACSWVAEILRRQHPTHVVAAIDRPWPTWRDDLAPETYKAARKERAEERAADRAAITASVLEAEALLLDVLGIQTFGARGFEGDDVIAAFTARFRWAGLDVGIVTRDKDFAQLVTPISPLVRILDFATGNEMGAREVEDRYHVRAEQFASYLALVGDSTDGYPGCPGIGPVAAVALLERFDTAEEAVLAAVGARPGWWEPSVGAQETWRKKLEAGAELVALSGKLARFRTDITGVDAVDLDELAALPVPDLAFV